MKITDIINEADTRILKTIGSIPIILTDGMPSAKTGKYIGNGVQTDASQHASGTIVKHTELGGLNDPVLAWINQCMFLKNPYLPVYLNAKIYTPDKTRFILISTSKPLSGKLADLQTDFNKVKALASIKLSKTGEAEFKRWKDNSNVNYNTEDYSDNPELRLRASFMAGLFSADNNNGLRKLEQMTDDNDVTEAARILQEFDGSDLDLHSGNFMWDGYQLVINDPVYSEWSNGNNKLSPEEMDKPVKPSAGNVRKEQKYAQGRVDSDYEMYKESLLLRIKDFIEDGMSDSDIVAKIKGIIEASPKPYAPVLNRLGDQTLEQWIADAIKAQHRIN